MSVDMDIETNICDEETVIFGLLHYQSKDHLFLDIARNSHCGCNGNNPYTTLNWTKNTCSCCHKRSEDNSAGMFWPMSSVTSLDIQLPVDRNWSQSCATTSYTDISVAQSGQSSYVAQSAPSSYVAQSAPSSYVAQSGVASYADIPVAQSQGAPYYSDVPIAQSQVAPYYSDVPVAQSQVAPYYSDVPVVQSPQSQMAPYYSDVPVVQSPQSQVAPYYSDVPVVQSPQSQVAPYYSDVPVVQSPQSQVAPYYSDVPVVQSPQSQVAPYYSDVPVVQSPQSQVAPYYSDVPVVQSQVAHYSDVSVPQSHADVPSIQYCAPVTPSYAEMHESHFHPETKSHSEAYLTQSYAEAPVVQTHADVPATRPQTEASVTRLHTESPVTAPCLDVPVTFKKFIPKYLVSNSRFANLKLDNSFFKKGESGFSRFWPENFKDVDGYWEPDNKVIDRGKKSKFYKYLQRKRKALLELPVTNFIKQIRNKRDELKLDSPRRVGQNHKIREESNYKLKFYDKDIVKRCPKLLRGDPCGSKCNYIHALPREDGISCRFYYFHKNCDERKCIYLHSARCSSENRAIYNDEWSSVRCPDVLIGQKCTRRLCRKNHTLPKDDGVCCLMQLKLQCFEGSNCIYLHREELNEDYNQNSSRNTNMIDPLPIENRGRANTAEVVKNNSPIKIKDSTSDSLTAKDTNTDIVDMSESDNDGHGDYHFSSCDESEEDSKYGYYYSGVGDILNRLKGIEKVEESPEVKDSGKISRSINENKITLITEKSKSVLNSVCDRSSRNEGMRYPEREKETRKQSSTVTSKSIINSENLADHNKLSYSDKRSTNNDSNNALVDVNAPSITSGSALNKSRCEDLTQSIQNILNSGLCLSNVKQEPIIDLDSTPDNSSDQQMNTVFSICNIKQEKETNLNEEDCIGRQQEVPSDDNYAESKFQDLIFSNTKAELITLNSDNEDEGDNTALVTRVKKETVDSSSYEETRVKKERTDNSELITIDSDEEDYNDTTTIITRVKEERINRPSYEEIRIKEERTENFCQERQVKEESLDYSSFNCTAISTKNKMGSSLSKNLSVKESSSLDGTFSSAGKPVGDCDSRNLLNINSDLTSEGLNYDSSHKEVNKTSQNSNSEPSSGGLNCDSSDREITKTLQSSVSESCISANENPKKEQPNLSKKISNLSDNINCPSEPNDDSRTKMLSKSQHSASTNCETSKNVSGTKFNAEISNKTPKHFESKISEKITHSNSKIYLKEKPLSKTSKMDSRDESNLKYKSHSKRSSDEKSKENRHHRSTSTKHSQSKTSEKSKGSSKSHESSKSHSGDLLDQHLVVRSTDISNRTTDVIFKEILANESHSSSTSRSDTSQKERSEVPVYKLSKSTDKTDGLKMKFSNVKLKHKDKTSYSCKLAKQFRACFVKLIDINSNELLENLKKTSQKINSTSKSSSSHKSKKIDKNHVENKEKSASSSTKYKDSKYKMKHSGNEISKSRKSSEREGSVETPKKSSSSKNQFNLLERKDRSTSKEKHDLKKSRIKNRYSFLEDVKEDESTSKTHKKKEEFQTESYNESKDLRTKENKGQKERKEFHTKENKHRLISEKGTKVKSIDESKNTIDCDNISISSTDVSKSDPMYHHHKKVDPNSTNPSLGNRSDLNSYISSFASSYSDLSRKHSSNKRKISVSEVICSPNKKRKPDSKLSNKSRRESSSYRHNSSSSSSSNDMETHVKKLSSKRESSIFLDENLNTELNGNDKEFQNPKNIQTNNNSIDEYLSKEKMVGEHKISTPNKLNCNIQNEKVGRSICRPGPLSKKLAWIAHENSSSPCANGRKLSFESKPKPKSRKTNGSESEKKLILCRADDSAKRKSESRQDNSSSSKRARNLFSSKSNLNISSLDDAKSSEKALTFSKKDSQSSDYVKRIDFDDTRLSFTGQSDTEKKLNKSNSSINSFYSKRSSSDNDLNRLTKKPKSINEIDSPSTTAENLRLSENMKSNKHTSSGKLKNVSNPLVTNPSSDLTSRLINQSQPEKCSPGNISSPKLGVKIENTIEDSSLSPAVKRSPNTLPTRCTPSNTDSSDPENQKSIDMEYILTAAQETLLSIKKGPFERHEVLSAFFSLCEEHNLEDRDPDNSITALDKNIRLFLSSLLVNKCGVDVSIRELVNMNRHMTLAEFNTSLQVIVKNVPFLNQNS